MTDANVVCKMAAILSRHTCVKNALGPNDAMWRHRSHRRDFIEIRVLFHNFTTCCMSLSCNFTRCRWLIVIRIRFVMRWTLDVLVDFENSSSFRLLTCNISRNTLLTLYIITSLWGKVEQRPKAWEPRLEAGQKLVPIFICQDLWWSNMDESCNRTPSRLNIRDLTLL